MHMYLQAPVGSVFTGLCWKCIYRPLLRVYLQGRVGGIFTGLCDGCIYRAVLEVYLQASVTGVSRLPELMYPSWCVASDVA